jgi:hypothetical protein
MSGVQPSSSAFFTSAPCLMSQRVFDIAPLRLLHRRISAVAFSSSGFVALTLAPFSIAF